MGEPTRHEASIELTANRPVRRATWRAVIVNLVCLGLVVGTNLSRFNLAEMIGMVAVTLGCVSVSGYILQTARSYTDAPESAQVAFHRKAQASLTSMFALAFGVALFCLVTP